MTRDQFHRFLDDAMRILSPILPFHDCLQIILALLVDCLRPRIEEREPRL